ncbi:MAG: class I SAM-dependent methyltransferase [Bacteroidales bacterium]|nr:class I SAM-dependent methyltransferase [Bacteroidales bacterium]
MSSSVPCNIPFVLKLVARNIFSKSDITSFDFQKISEGKPVPLPAFKILDVGCGYGKWAFLIRDTFEVMLGQNFTRKDWKISITGVEPFKKCITNIQKKLYDVIISDDIFKVLPQLEDYDLIILGDIIEHFEKAKAYDLLGELFKHTGNIIISTPLGFMPQGAWADNILEIHRSGWELEDFSRFTVVEYKILKDELFSDVLMQMPDLPGSMKNGIRILVLWLKTMKNDPAV